MNDHTKIALGILTFLGLAAGSVKLMQGPSGKIFAIIVLSIGSGLFGLLVFSCLLMAKNKQDQID